MTQRPTLPDPERFAGRQWVFADIDGWLGNPASNSCYLLLGEPGSGKSAIAGQLWRYSIGEAGPGKGLQSIKPRFLNAVHFCKANDQPTIDPYSFVEALVMQLSKSLEGLDDLIAEGMKTMGLHIAVHQETGPVGPSAEVTGVKIGSLQVKGLSVHTSFVRLVREPLEKLCEKRPGLQVVILVDALDECLTYGENNIFSLLTNQQGLSPQIRFLLTSRKIPAVEEGFRQAARLNLSELANAHKNNLDVALFVQQAMQDRPRLKQLVQVIPAGQYENDRNLIVERADGNFQYVHFLLLSLEHGDITFRDLTNLPRDLHSLYNDLLTRSFLGGMTSREDLERRRQDWQKEFAPLMGLLTIAREPLTLEDIAMLTGEDEIVMSIRLQKLAQVLDVIQPAEPSGAGKIRYRYFHLSIIEFLRLKDLQIVDQGQATRAAKNLFYLPEQTWEQFLVDHYRQGHRDWSGVDWRGVDGYSIRYLSDHLSHLSETAENGEFAALLQQLIQPALMREKFRRYGTHQSFAMDVRQAMLALKVASPGDLIPLARLGLLYAGLVSSVQDVPVYALGALARLGQEETEKALGLTLLQHDWLKQAQAFAEIAQALQDAGRLIKAQEVISQGQDLLSRQTSGVSTGWINLDRLNVTNLALLGQLEDAWLACGKFSDDFTKKQAQLIVLREAILKKKEELADQIASEMKASANRDYYPDEMLAALAQDSAQTAFAWCRRLNNDQNWESLWGSTARAMLESLGSGPLEQWIAALEDPTAREILIGAAVRQVIQQGQVERALALLDQLEGSERWIEAACTILEWVFLNQGLENARALYRQWAAPPRMEAHRRMVDRLYGDRRFHEAVQALLIVEDRAERGAAWRQFRYGITRAGTFQQLLEAARLVNPGEDLQDDDLADAGSLLLKANQPLEAIKLASQIQEEFSHVRLQGQALWVSSLQDELAAALTLLTGIECDRALLDLTRIFLKNSQVGPAEQALARIENDDTRSYSRVELVKRLAGMGRFAEALEAADALTNNWTRGDAIREICETMIEAGLLEEAEERAAGLDAEAQAAIYAHLFAAASGQGESSRAEVYFGKALDAFARASYGQRGVMESLMSWAHSIPTAQAERFAALGQGIFPPDPQVQSETAPSLSQLKFLHLAGKNVEVETLFPRLEDYDRGRFQQFAALAEYASTGSLEGATRRLKLLDQVGYDAGIAALARAVCRRAGLAETLRFLAGLPDPDRFDTAIAGLLVPLFTSAEAVAEGRQRIAAFLSTEGCDNVLRRASELLLEKGWAAGAALAAGKIEDTFYRELTLSQILEHMLICEAVEEALALIQSLPGPDRSKVCKSAAEHLIDQGAFGLVERFRGPLIQLDPNLGDAIWSVTAPYYSRFNPEDPRIWSAAQQIQDPGTRRDVLEAAAANLIAQRGLEAALERLADLPAADRERILAESIAKLLHARQPGLADIQRAIDLSTKLATRASVDSVGSALLGALEAMPVQASALLREFNQRHQVEGYFQDLSLKGLGMYFAQLGNEAEVQALCQEISDREMRGEVLSSLAGTLLRSGEGGRKRAIKLLEDLIAPPENPRQGEDRDQMLVSLARALFDLGKPEEAAQVIEIIRSPFQQVNIRIRRGWNLVALGSDRRARAELETVFALTREVEPGQRVQALSWLARLTAGLYGTKGVARILAGLWEEGEKASWDETKLGACQAIFNTALSLAEANWLGWFPKNRLLLRVGLARKGLNAFWQRQARRILERAEAVPRGTPGQAGGLSWLAKGWASLHDPEKGAGAARLAWRLAKDHLLDDPNLVPNCLSAVLSTSQREEAAAWVKEYTASCDRPSSPQVAEKLKHDLLYFLRDAAIAMIQAGGADSMAPLIERIRADANNQVKVYALAAIAEALLKENQPEKAGPVLQAVYDASVLLKNEFRDHYVSSWVLRTFLKAQDAQRAAEILGWIEQRPDSDAETRLLTLSELAREYNDAGDTRQALSIAKGVIQQLAQMRSPAARASAQRDLIYVLRQEDAPQVLQMQRNALLDACLAGKSEYFNHLVYLIELLQYWKDWQGLGNIGAAVQEVERAFWGP